MVVQLLEYSADMVISSCCSYHQLQLRIRPRGIVFGEVKQSTIYSEFDESCCKRPSKNKISYHGWLITMTS